MNFTVRTAIERQRLLTLSYDGYTRVVEPHAYGITKEGDEVIRVWQVDGGSVSGERSGWKLLRIDETYGIQAGTEEFQGARPGYKRGDKAMHHIYVQL